MTNTPTTPRTPVNQGTSLSFSASNPTTPTEQNTNLNTPPSIGRQRLEAARAHRHNRGTPLVMPVDLDLDNSERLNLRNSVRYPLANPYEGCRPVLRPHHDNNHDNHGGGGRPFGGSGMACC